ncbi:MAG: hypothetical protein PHW83_07580 [Bacteroidales bacterium]|nr:hypothetical protein [Bacteroidales bacterium]
MQTKKKHFIILVISSLVALVLPLMSLAQNDKTNSLFIGVGVYHLNSEFRETNWNLEYSNIRQPFICNAFGYNQIKIIKNNYILTYGASIIQNRLKFETQLFDNSTKIITKAYLSLPIMIGYKFRNTFISIGPALDYYLYNYVNYVTYNGMHGTDVNQYNKFTLWGISFIDGEIPFSFHIESKINTEFYLQNKNKIGFYLSCNIYEIASFYGRNSSIDQDGKYAYYYPLSVSLGVVYIWGNTQSND